MFVCLFVEKILGEIDLNVPFREKICKQLLTELDVKLHAPAVATQVLWMVVVGEGWSVWVRWWLVWVGVVGGWCG